MFVSRAELWGRNQETSAHIRTCPAALKHPEGGEEIGVAVFSDKRLVTVLTDGGARRLALALVDTIEETARRQSEIKREPETVNATFAELADY